MKWISLLFLFASLTFAQKNCDLADLPKGAADIIAVTQNLHESQGEELAKIRKHQEAIWEYNWAGNEEKSDQIKHDLEKILTSKPEKMKFHGEGSSISLKLYFPDGTKALFRMIDDEVKDEADINGDLAAYAVDQKLNLNLVPMSVATVIDVPTDIIPEDKRSRFKGGKIKGVAVYWVDDVDGPTMANTMTKPQDMKFFDQLIFNTDRGARNYLIRKSNGHYVGIDHDRAFRDAADYKKHGVRSDKMNMPTGEVLERLRNTPEKVWRKILGKYLDKKRVQEFLDRRRAFLNPDQPSSALIYSN